MIIEILKKNYIHIDNKPDENDLWMQIKVLREKNILFLKATCNPNNPTYLPPEIRAKIIKATGIKDLISKESLSTFSLNLEKIIDKNAVLKRNNPEIGIYTRKKT